MSFFNRFIESIIPAPDKEDGIVQRGSGHSPLRRSARSEQSTKEALLEELVNQQRLQGSRPQKADPRLYGKDHASERHL